MYCMVSIDIKGITWGNSVASSPLHIIFIRTTWISMGISRTMCLSKVKYTYMFKLTCLQPQFLSWQKIWNSDDKEKATFWTETQKRTTFLTHLLFCKLMHCFLCVVVLNQTMFVYYTWGMLWQCTFAVFAFFYSSQSTAPSIVEGKKPDCHCRAL